MYLHIERRMTPRWAKIGPPLWGHNRIAAGVVTTLAQETRLHGTPFLTSGYSVVMTMLSNAQERL